MIFWGKVVSYHSYGFKANEPLEFLAYVSCNTDSNSAAISGQTLFIISSPRASACTPKSRHNALFAMQLSLMNCCDVKAM